MFENNTNKPNFAYTKKLKTDEFRGMLDTLRSIYVSLCSYLQKKILKFKGL
jgi:hypothetical protein